jgi:predicted nucleotidyltransferase
MSQLESDLKIAKTIFLPEILKDENVIGVLFTGSRVIGDVNSNSDYDFRVLLKDGKSRYRKGFYLGDLFAEIFCNSYIQEMNYFHEEVSGNDHKAIDLFMYKTGIIIYDPTNKMSEIKSKATELYDLGPTPLLEKQKDWIRYDLAITKLKLEVLKGDDGDLFYLLRVEAKLADYFFKLHNIWKVRFRDTSNKISSTDSEFYNCFMVSLKSSELSERASSLIKSIEYLQVKFKLDTSVEFSV